MPAPDPDCDDTPKLTAEEWAYVEAMSGQPSTCAACGDLVPENCDGPSGRHQPAEAVRFVDAPPEADD